MFPMFSVDFPIYEYFLKLTENFPKNIAHERESFRKHFPEFYIFPKFSENFEAILVKVLFQFCLTIESSGQDGVNDQPIKLRESKAG